jgi:adenylate cyclase
VQDDIARRVVGAATVKLTRLEQERVLAKPTENLAAYEYVLRGRERLVNATREQNDAAREMFRRAIDLDPNYAAAYAALGGTYFDAVVSGWTEFRDEDVERAEMLAQKALPSTRRRPAPTDCSPSSICTEDVTISRWGRSTARWRSTPATRRTM